MGQKHSQGGQERVIRSVSLSHASLLGHSSNGSNSIGQSLILLTRSCLNRNPYHMFDHIVLSRFSWLRVLRNENSHGTMGNVLNDQEFWRYLTMVYLELKAKLRSTSSQFRRCHTFRFQLKHNA